MLTGNVEEKYEAKARHRANQANKIKGESSFATGTHGSLSFKVGSNGQQDQFNLPYHRLITTGAYFMFILRRQILVVGGVRILLHWFIFLMKQQECQHSR